MYKEITEKEIAEILEEDVFEILNILYNKDKKTLLYDFLSVIEDQNEVDQKSTEKVYKSNLYNPLFNFDWCKIVDMNLVMYKNDKYSRYFELLNIIENNNSYENKYCKSSNTWYSSIFKHYYRGSYHDLMLSPMFCELDTVRGEDYFKLSEELFDNDANLLIDMRYLVRRYYKQFIECFYIIADKELGMRNRMTCIKEYLTNEGLNNSEIFSLSMYIIRICMYGKFKGLMSAKGELESWENFVDLHSSSGIKFIHQW